MNSFGDTSYFYHRDDKYNVTIAYQRSKLTGQVRFGAAFCCPGDKFLKPMGRKIAKGRMENYSHNIDDYCESNRWETHSNILNALESCYEYTPRSFKYNNSDYNNNYYSSDYREECYGSY